MTEAARGSHLSGFCFLEFLLDNGHAGATRRGPFLLRLAHFCEVVEFLRCEVFFRR